LFTVGTASAETAAGITKALKSKSSTSIAESAPLKSPRFFIILSPLFPAEKLSVLYKLIKLFGIDIKNVKQNIGCFVLGKQKHKRQKGIPRHIAFFVFYRNNRASAYADFIGEFFLRHTKAGSQHRKIIGHIFNMFLSVQFVIHNHNLSSQ
jgi:hypothetical protein